MSYSGRKFRKKNFSEKVKANKSLKWFDCEKKKIFNEISKIEKNINSMRFFFNSIPRDLIEEERRIVKRLRDNILNLPETSLKNLFGNKKELWSEENSCLLLESKRIKNSIIDSGCLSLEAAIFESWFFRTDLTIESEIENLIKRDSASINRLNDDLDEMKPKHDKLKKKDAKEQARKSKSARIDKKSRDQADIIKRKLDKTEHCPYCGELVKSDSYHADHIYPLSQGGLETMQNMIYVCSTCNLSKSDDPLYVFCQRSGFDFDAIALRLKKMGKFV